MAHPYQKHRGKYPHSGSEDRVDKLYGKFARGGKVKHGAGKGHHTKINIIVAPKAGGADGPPPPMMPPGGGGAPPAPPMGAMPPKAPMGPPAGGIPGMGAKPPGAAGLGMKRGGKVPGGISTPENLKGWADYASKGTRYERGGKVPMKSGSYSGEGRLEKIKAYGKRARGRKD